MAENKKVSSVSFFNSRLTSVISISLVLFLLGLILLIGMLGNKLSVYVKENLSFSIVLKDNQKETEIKKMQKSLDALPFIKSTEYISKEQAAKELEEELGENPETFLGFNPLQASIEVKLHSEYANPDSLQVIEKKIRNYTSVSELLYRKDMMEMVHNNMKRLGLILLTLAAVLMIISFVLISNTIRLLIYSKRFLIHTMKLVGATSGFIRRPFVKYNIVSGIFASILAILMLTGALYYLQNELKGFIQILDMQTLLLVYVAVFALGIVLSVIATIFAVNKYLRMGVDKLYYIECTNNKELRKMAKRDFAFGKENFILIAVAVACIVLGFILMSGGGSGDNTFNPDIFSARRIVVAPVVTVIGFVMMIFGILKNSKDKEVTE